MSVNTLFTLREWLTIDEAAQHLHGVIGEPVTEADVLRLALDGHLKLSVVLPEGTAGDCWNVPEALPPGTDLDYWAQPEATESTPIAGLWDLPLIPPGRLQVANRFSELRGLPEIRLDGLVGALVEHPGTHCRIRAEGAKFSSPPSVLPAGTAVVVRTSAIIQFASTFLKPNPLDKPLGESERTTLLIIIAALADKAHIDRSKPYGKGAKDIAAVTQTIGAAVSEKTIGNYFALIPDAIEARSK